MSHRGRLQRRQRHPGVHGGGDSPTVVGNRRVSSVLVAMTCASRLPYGSLRSALTRSASLASAPPVQDSHHQRRVPHSEHTVCTER